MLAIVRKGQAFCRILRFFDSKMYRPEKRRTCTKKTSVLVQLRERTKKPAEIVSAGFHLEVPSRFELENKGFADLRLTTWLWHRKKWSGRRGSDSRPPPWQGGALPTELLPHIHSPDGEPEKTVRTKRLELLRLGHQNLNLARLPIPPRPHTGRPGSDRESDPLEIRTPDTLIKSQVLCQLS